jgi:hypothetical protein
LFTERIIQVLGAMFAAYGSGITIFGQAAFSDPAADIPRIIQLCFKAVQESAQDIVNVCCQLTRVCVVSHVFQHQAGPDGDDDSCDDDEELEGMLECTHEVFDGFRLLMDALLSTYKEPCVAFVQAIVLPTLGEFLSKPMFGGEIKATAMSLMNSIMKHGGAAGSAMVPAIIPLWLTASLEEDADVRTTAIYGIGLCAMSNPGFINQGLAPIWQCLQTVLGKKAEMVSDPFERVVWENAVAATFRLFRSGLLTDASIYNGLLGLFPIEDDLDEAAAVVEIVVSMSDRIRPPAGLRNLAEQQVKLLKDNFDDFEQVRGRLFGNLMKVVHIPLPHALQQPRFVPNVTSSFPCSFSYTNFAHLS